MVGFAEVMSLSYSLQPRCLRTKLSLCSLKPGCALLGAEISLGVEGTHGTSSGFHGDERQTIWNLPVSIR